MARNDAPGTRTTDLLPPLPDLAHELAAEAGAAAGSLDL
ncbi:MAG: putative trans-1,2-dihydrobenzene-1,2-diol dehydrogenase, partial [Actinomyces urogenitalis DORA_12]